VLGAAAGLIQQLEGHGAGEEADMQDESTPARSRGFANMTQDQQRAIASKGGRIAHEKRTAHEFSSEEARRAGHLGGLSVSRDRAHMAAIGREGGRARRQRAETAGAPTS
jgi:general stress protein YciG